MPLRLALLSLLAALVASVPGFAFGSSLLGEVDRLAFVAFLTASVVLFVVDYVRAGGDPSPRP